MDKLSRKSAALASEEKHARLWGGGGVPGVFRGSPRGVSGGGLGGVGGLLGPPSWSKKTPGVCFHAAFDFQAPGPRNTTKMLKNEIK